MEEAAAEAQKLLDKMPSKASYPHHLTNKENIDDFLERVDDV